MTTSAVPTSLRTISRPSGLSGFRVRQRLLRLTCRNIAPMPSSVTGVTQRSSPPSMRSTRMTSAPRSPSSAPHHGPAMYRPKSMTRTPSSTPAMADLPLVSGPARAQPDASRDHVGSVRRRMNGRPQPHPRPRPRGLGREPQWFAAAGLVIGVAGAVWTRAEPAAATLADGLSQVLRTSLPGLLAVGVGLAVWVHGTAAPERLKGLDAAGRRLRGHRRSLAVVVDLMVQAAREFLEASRPPGPSRWELPLRLTVSGLALGAVAALITELVRRLTVDEGEP